MGRGPLGDEDLAVAVLVHQAGQPVGLVEVRGLGADRGRRAEGVARVALDHRGPLIGGRVGAEALAELEVAGEATGAEQHPVAGADGDPLAAALRDDAGDSAVLGDQLPERGPGLDPDLAPLRGRQQVADVGLAHDQRPGAAQLQADRAGDDLAHLGSRLPAPAHGEQAAEVVHRAHHHPTGQRRARAGKFAPISQGPCVDRRAGEHAPVEPAARSIGVVVRVVGDQPEDDALAPKELDQPRSTADERLLARCRGRGALVADHVLEVSDPVLDGVGEAGLPAQWVTRDPERAVGERGGASGPLALLDQDLGEPTRSREDRGDQAAAARPDDDDVDGLLGGGHWPECSRQARINPAFCSGLEP